MADMTEGAARDGTLRFSGLLPGDEYYTSEWFELDEEHLREFAHSTYLDPEHVDLTISRNNPFGSDLVDGFWMVSMLLYFNFKYGRRGSDREYGFNYGLDGVRFTAPLILGERIRVRAVIEDVRPHARGVIVSTRNTMEVEGRDKPCMVAVLHLLRINPKD
ncbi:MaoC/PaaZ C-terminal domain-containing protein [Brevibacterium album]|uniref:MaoC/PaaZ C-terminal domain-containing protein n=1 Tax=Brevibacterium album TaxID=417948 RepID=UPI000400C5B3|nr:MaoC/PaaZ C-terminal domain-containing protein [Brevibacterium album]